MFSSERQGNGVDGEKRAHLKEKAAEELRLLVLITAYLAVFFVSFLTYKRLLQRDEGVSAFRYGYALFEALIVAKVILIGKAMGLGKKAGRRTLAFAVVRSSLVYGALVLVFEILEQIVEGLLHHKTLLASLPGVPRLRPPRVRREGAGSLCRVPAVLRLLGAQPSAGRKEALRALFPEGRGPESRLKPALETRATLLA